MRWINDSVRYAAMGNMASQIVAMLGQLVFLPVYILAWGAEIYGFWIICVGVTIYAALLDFGVSQAAANEVIAALAKKKQDDALDWAGLTVSITGLLVASFLVAGAVFSPLIVDFIRHILGRSEFSWILYFSILIQLGLLVLFNMFVSLLRAVGGNATASWLAFFVILGETICPPIIALFGGGVEYAILGMVLPRLFGTAISMMMLRVAAPWVKVVSINQVNWSKAKDIASPSIANLFLPGGVALFLQGTLTLVGGMFGTEAAAIFGISRTLSRLPFQVGYVYTRAQLPNMTRIVAAQDRVEFYRVVLRLLRVFLWLTIPALIAYALMGAWFIELWTHGLLHVEDDLVLALAVGSGLHAGWHFLISPLMASNKHGKFSIVHILSVIAFLSVGDFLDSLSAVAWAAAALDLFVFFVSALLFRYFVLSKF